MQQIGGALLCLKGEGRSFKSMLTGSGHKLTSQEVLRPSRVSKICCSALQHSPIIEARCLASDMVSDLVLAHAFDW